MNYPPLNDKYIVCSRCTLFIVDDKVTINQAIHRGWRWKGEELVCPKCAVKHSAASVLRLPNKF
jgi:hypothetical protein